MFSDHAVPSGTNSSLLCDIFATPGSDETMEEEENSMEMELDKYLSLCRQSKTHDLLQWWRANCSAFPVLT